MSLLIAGVLLWAAVHFIPSLGQPLKQSMIDQIGANAYKGVFSLLVIISLLMMVFGWRSIEQPSYFYTLPAWSRPLGTMLLIIGFILFGASKAPTRIKQFIRHPQLSGVLVWALAHLMMNGDSRSLALFGGMACWAILEMILISRREGAWIKPEVPGWGQEIKGLTISLVIFAVVAFAHPWIAGVPVR